MKKADLSNAITATTTALNSAIQGKGNAAAAVVSAKQAHARKAAEAVSSGKVDLKVGNEASRKADIAAYAEAETEALRVAEVAQDTANLAYDLAKLDWDSARQQVAIWTSAAE